MPRKFRNKVSPQEQRITEKIFMLNMSLQLLRHGRWPFHQAAKSLIKKEINRLKSTPTTKYVKESTAP